MAFDGLDFEPVLLSHLRQLSIPTPIVWSSRHWPPTPTPPPLRPWVWRKWVLCWSWPPLPIISDWRGVTGWLRELKWGIELKECQSEWRLWGRVSELRECWSEVEDWEWLRAMHEGVTEGCAWRAVWAEIRDDWGRHAAWVAAEEMRDLDFRVRLYTYIYRGIFVISVNRVFTSPGFESGFGFFWQNPDPLRVFFFFFLNHTRPYF